MSDKRLSLTWFIISSIFLMVFGACALPFASTPVAPVIVEPTYPPTQASIPAAGLDQTTPAKDQPTDAVETPDICHDDICFSYDDSIACNVTGETIPASDGEMWDNYPQHVQFTFDCYPLSGTFHNPVLRVYPIADYRARFDHIGEMLLEISSLLETKPADPQSIPFLPVWNAAALFRSNVDYIDFENGRGVRFLTQFGQAAWPINNLDMFYTFQGVTNDGFYYVTSVLPASNPILPMNGDTIPGGDHMAFSENFQNYALDIKNQLNSQTPESFTPNLILLDEMIRSLRVH